MKTSFGAFALILTLLGKSKQNEIIEVDMQFENGMLKSVTSHLVSKIQTKIPQINDHPIQAAPQVTEYPITTQIFDQIIPTQVAQILDNGFSAQVPQIFTIPVIPQNILTQENLNNNAPTHYQKQDNFNGCMIVPMTTQTSVQQKSTTTSVIHITNTVIETIKVLVHESRKTSEAKQEKVLKSKKETKTETEKILETTEVISLAVITPTVKINLYDKRETDIDVNEIWKILESESTPKRNIQSKAGKHLKIKKNKEKLTSPDVKIKKIKEVNIDSDVDVQRNETKVLEQRLRKLENLLIHKQKHRQTDKIPSRAKLISEKIVKLKKKAPIKPIAKNKIVAKIKPVCKGPLQVYEQVKVDLKKKDKKLHNLPAKKKKGSCLVEQTVIIPAGKLSTPTIPPPLVSKIAQNIGSTGKLISDKLFYNCVTNYAGTIIKTVTSMTIVPLPTTHLTVKTETVFARATELLTEVLYTPYTVTTTSTNTMYMIKVTTVNGAGCKNCELDSNGMVLPAGQMPPGIFATPLNEVDPKKFDIIGYAGMNPPNFNPQLQGFKAQINI